MTDSDHRVVSVEEKFLASLVGKDIRVRLDPRSCTWSPVYVMSYQYPKMVIHVEDCWHQRNRGHIHLGESGRMYPDAGDRLMVMEPPPKRSILHKPLDQNES